MQAAQEELDELVLNPKNNMAIKLSEEKENLVLKSEEEITEINCLQKTELDEKLEQFVKDNQTLISFEKISEGQYRFGTRIVQAKILKDKIAIRMGGGYFF